MCGIVGYTGQRNAAEVLLGGLQRLEYRGYDSAGLALVTEDGLRSIRSVGKVRALVDQLHPDGASSPIHDGQAGIAHTRWATHGPPTEANAHPHCDQSGRIALVHNGIIENYREIRKRLQAQGHEFLSDTDSEALALLIGEFYDGNLLEAVCAALQLVEGTFGIAVLCQDEPNTLIAARRGSPIVIGVAEHETLVASDAAALAAHTSQVVFLNDDDVAVLTPGDLEIRNIDNVPVSREIAKLDWDLGAAEKGGFEHFMLKEIFEQPDSLRNALRGRLDAKQSTAILSGLNLTPREIGDVGRLVMLACGTSMHAGMVGEYFFEDLADLPTDVDQAAEFRYRNPIVTPRDMVLAISQSGETADTLAAVREAQNKGALVAGVCNVVGSTLARETGRGVYLHAGPEIGVASTKAFTCQVAVLLMMALKFGRCRRLSHETGIQICSAIERIPEQVEAVLQLNERIADVAALLADAHSAFFIGRGTMYPVALEGALKLKEISYIHAEGYHAAELKHGPIALLEESVPVVALAPDVPGRDKTLANIQECRARNAPVIAILTEGDDAVADSASAVLHIPAGSPLTTPITTCVACQLLAYHVARLRGCEIDQPRNLAKSVTVE